MNVNTAFLFFWHFGSCAFGLWACPVMNTSINSGVFILFVYRFDNCEIFDGLVCSWNSFLVEFSGASEFKIDFESQTEFFYFLNLSFLFCSDQISLKIRIFPNRKSIHRSHTNENLPLWNEITIWKCEFELNVILSRAFVCCLNPISVVFPNGKCLNFNGFPECFLNEKSLNSFPLKI